MALSLTRVPGAHAILVSEMADAFALFRSCDCRRGAEETGRPGQTVSVSLRERGERYENPHEGTGYRGGV